MPGYFFVVFSPIVKVTITDSLEFTYSTKVSFTCLFTPLLSLLKNGVTLATVISHDVQTNLE